MFKQSGHTGSATTVDLIGAFRSDRLLLTQDDAWRLQALLDRRISTRDASVDPVDSVALLGAALTSAIVVPPHRIPADVVTMRSRCVLKDLATGSLREVVIVYPDEEEQQVGRVSVLSPLGAALLGLSPGAVIGRRRSAGDTCLLRVESVEYQPEDAKEFHL